jgi:hypothetical protein
MHSVRDICIDSNTDECDVYPDMFGDGYVHHLDCIDFSKAKHVTVTPHQLEYRRDIRNPLQMLEPLQLRYVIAFGLARV